MRLFRLSVTFALLIGSAVCQIVTTLTTPAVLDASTVIAQAQQALTGGVTVSDLSLNSTATWKAGGTNASGSATLKTKGVTEARLDISAGEVVRTEVRNDSTQPDGQWMGQDGSAHRLPAHNCLTLAAWFSPASFIAALSGSNAVLSYVAAETRNGAAVDHVRFSQHPANIPNAAANALFTRLSQTEVYFDASSHLPRAVTWKAHPDHDYSRDVPVEVRYDDYR